MTSATSVSYKLVLKVLITYHRAGFSTDNCAQGIQDMSVRVQVEALLSIIKEATYNALEQYETTGVLTPVLDSTEGHPLDQVDDNIALKKIISKLEGACEQLCTTLAPPSHTIMNVCLQYFILAYRELSLREPMLEEGPRLWLGLPSGSRPAQACRRAYRQTKRAPCR